MSAPLNPVQWEENLPIRPRSPAWRVTTRAIWGRVPLTAEEETLFLKLSGGRPAQSCGWDFAFVLAGRRGNKTEVFARDATFEGIHGGHEESLAPGQVGVIAVVCPEHKHAREFVGYVRGLAALPAVKKHVERVTDTSVRFKNGIEIRVVTANELAVSATIVMLVIDEAARLPGAEAGTPDKAMISTLLPGLAPIVGAPRRNFLAATSAFIDEGWAFETDRDNFGRGDADVLVLRGSTELFNPNIDRAWLERERRKDPLAAAREYGQDDVPPEWMPSLTECWFGQDAIKRCVDRGRGAIDPVVGIGYFVAIDAAFSKDNFGIAVVCNAIDEHERRNVLVAYIAALRPPQGGSLSPRDCVDHTVKIMKRYGTNHVVLDQYCAAPLIEAFADRGARAIQIPWTGTGAKSKAVRYAGVREQMRDGLIRLPDDAALLREFYRVRGRMSQSGHESIEASGKGVDDRVSALVMACSVAREGHARAVYAERRREEFLLAAAGLAQYEGDDGPMLQLQRDRMHEATMRTMGNPEWVKRAAEEPLPRNQRQREPELEPEIEFNGFF